MRHEALASAFGASTNGWMQVCASCKFIKLVQSGKPRKPGVKKPGWKQLSPCLDHDDPVGSVHGLWASVHVPLAKGPRGKCNMLMRKHSMPEGANNWTSVRALHKSGYEKI